MMVLDYSKHYMNLPVLKKTGNTAIIKRQENKQTKTE